MKIMTRDSHPDQQQLRSDESASKQTQRESLNAYIEDSLGFSGGDRFVGFLITGLRLLDMSHQQLADKLEIIPATIARWTSGDTAPTTGMQTLAISTLRKLMVDAVNSYQEKCTRCNGSGVESFDPPAPDGYHAGHEGACGDCNGSGTVITDWASYWHDYDERFRVR